MADFFNRLADQLAPHDMVTGYHNHTSEFTPLDGEKPWDTLFGNTERRVIMQLDTGNAACGGADPVAILKQYPSRAGSVHLKPYSRSAGKADPGLGFRPPIGEDELPWQTIFQLCETSAATDWYVVEYESDAFPPMEAVARCLKALRVMGK
jgi:sugar phosphate isomerase/epimerase